MAESSDSGYDIIPLTEDSQVSLPNERQLAPQELQLAHSSGRNQLQVVIPNFNLNKGNFEKPNFGPVTNTHHVEANKIEHATIIHHHHNYPEQSQSSSEGDSENLTSPKKKKARKSKSKRNSNRVADIPEGYVKICDDLYMNTKEPIKKGTTVYKGFHVHVTGKKQWVAIKKIMPCEVKSESEVDILVNLSETFPHRNVIQVIRSKIYQSLSHKELYIIMELCKEQNLQDYLNENRVGNEPLDLNQTISFAKQLIDGIKHIHDRGIIHGDLKPENILFSLDGEIIKVSDFGISKQLQDSRSVTRLTGLGTDGYRAPETYTSDVISKSADIYSLGVVLFSLFTNGGHPYGEDRDLWIHNMKKNIGLDLSSLPEETGPVKDNLINLFKKIFQLDREKRPTIDEILGPMYPFNINSHGQSKEGPSPQQSIPNPETTSLQTERPCTSKESHSSLAAIVKKARDKAEQAVIDKAVDEAATDEIFDSEYDRAMNHEAYDKAYETVQDQLFEKASEIAWEKAFENAVDRGLDKAYDNGVDEAMDEAELKALDGVVEDVLDKATDDIIEKVVEKSLKNSWTSLNQ